MKMRTKKLITHLTSYIFFSPWITLPLILAFSFNTFQNNLIAQSNTSGKVDMTTAEYEEQLTAGYMRANGATEETINKWIKDHREVRNRPTGMFVNPNYQDPAHKNPTISAVGNCTDIGGENGWSVWEASTGYNTYPGSNPLGVTFDLTGIQYANPATLSPPQPPSWKWDITNGSPAGMMGPYGPRFDITSAGTHSCTPGPPSLPGAPTTPMPLVCPFPGFGSHSIKLGETENTGAGGYCNRVMGGVPAGTWIGGGCAERLTYDLLVTPADTNFTYAYAIVLENPCNAKHDRHQVPYAEIYILAPNGVDTVGCTYHKYTGDTLGHCQSASNSGMFEAGCMGPGGGSGSGYDVAYKPWSQVTLNLAAYIGQVVKVVITNVDCSLGAHYCESYWDFKCSSPTSSTVPFCAGQQTTISGPTESGTTYAWYQNHHAYTGPPSATSQNITPTPVLGDTFSVDVIQASGCKYRMTFVPEPSSIIPAFTYTTSCGKVNFTDGSTVTPVSPTNAVTSWNWQLPGGTPATSSSQNPGTVSYAAGTYTATLIVTSTAGCPDTIRHTFTVTGLSTTVTTTPIICGSNNGTATVNASTGATPYTYAWSPSGGNSSAATGLSSGNYTITVTDAGGCSRVNTFTLAPSSAGPVANFSSSPVCVGATTNFKDLSSGPPASWKWDFGDGHTSTAQNPGNTYTAQGTYTVTLIASAGTCSDTISLPVTVNGLPTAAFTSKNVCFNNPSVFTDQSSGNTTWDWNFGDGNTSTLQSPSHTYAASGNFTVTLVATNAAGCKDSVKRVMLVNPLPTANFTSPPVCQGDTTFFKDASTVSTGTVTAWSWNFDDPSTTANNISNLQNPYHVFSGMGPYNVLLTVTSDSGCQNNKTLPVVINGLPKAAFVSANVCANTLSGFTDGSASSAGDPISTYTWIFGDGTPNSGLLNPSHLYAAPGNYTVALIVTSQAGCKDTVENPLSIYAPPVADFSGSGKGCIPLCVNNFKDLSTSADGTIASCVWSFPGGTPSSSTSLVPPTVCYDVEGTYGASLIVTTTLGCKDTVQITPIVETFGWPMADFCIDREKAPSTDPVFNFCPLWKPNPGVTKWVWDFGDGSALDSVSTNPSHSYSATATANDFYKYDVCLNVQNEFGCWDQICKTVELIPEFTFYIPNTFTPNDDNDNQFFFGKGRGIKDYHIWVFDRWGNMIWDCGYSGHNTDWDSNGLDGMPSACKWDGVVVKGGPDMNGNSRQLAQEDVYVWKVKLTDIFDRKHDYIGHVNIVK